MALTDKLTNIANAIRTKTGKSEPMSLSEMPLEIESIQSDGETVANISESTTPSKDLTLSAFTQLGHLSFPKATEVGDGAFDKDQYMSSLTSIDLPKVTTVGNRAFANCVNLKNINIPLATTIGDSAFHYCIWLTNIDLPSATSIGNSAFRACFRLTSVNLPSATSIGESAFCECTNLTKVDLPSATSIGGGAFNNSTNLQAVILRTTSTVCVIDPTAIVTETDDSGVVTKWANFYVPTSMFETYRAAYEPAFEEYGYAGFFDLAFHKIEDFPEICG